MAINFYVTFIFLVMQKKNFFILGLFFIFLFSIAFVSPVFADFGLEDTAGAAGIKNGTSIPVLIGNVIGTALSMVSVLFFILMVYGGILWMTARGKEDQSKKALDTIIAAVIGILIVLGSYALTQFVFKALDGGTGRTNTSPNPVPAATAEFAPVTDNGGAVESWFACKCEWKNFIEGHLATCENNLEEPFDKQCLVGNLANQSCNEDFCKSIGGFELALEKVCDTRFARIQGTFNTSDLAVRACAESG